MTTPFVRLPGLVTGECTTTDGLHYLAAEVHPDPGPRSDDIVGDLTPQWGLHLVDVNLVMGPASKGASIPLRVFLDGEPATAARGTDVDLDSRGVVRDQKTYQLIRQAGASASRRFEIEFEGAGVEAYCFTFG